MNPICGVYAFKLIEYIVKESFHHTIQLYKSLQQLPDISGHRYRNKTKVYNSVNKPVGDCGVTREQGQNILGKKVKKNV
jgi:hypothetical protein